MAFGGMILTNKGREVLTRAQLGATLKFTGVAIGDGNYNGSYNDITALSNQLTVLDILRAEAKGSSCMLEADLSNKGLTTGFYLREVGILAQNGDETVLYAYTNAGEDAEHIPAGNGAVSVEKRLRLSLITEGVSNITFDAASVMYATQDAVDAIKDKTDKFTAEEAGYLSGITSSVQKQIDKIVSTLATVKVPVRLSCVKDNYSWYNDGRRIMQTYFGLDPCAQAALIENIVPGERYYVKTYCPNNLRDDSVLILGGKRSGDVDDGYGTVAVITEPIQICDRKEGVNLYTFVGSNEFDCVAISSFDKSICEIEVYQYFADKMGSV